MKSVLFKEWQNRQGHHVLITESTHWVEIGPRIYQSFPYHHVIAPTVNEINCFLKTNSAIGLRYSASWDAPQGKSSYHVVFTGKGYPIESLPKKARHDVKRGLQAASIEPISFERLGSEGWALRADTLERQGRVGAESAEGWKKLCQAAIGLQGFETWAAVVNGHLAASLIAFTCDDCCSILYQQSRTEYLPLGVNNALTFVFTNEVLKRPGPPWIFYGLHSLDAPASVDEFKFRMGYTAKPVRQRVVFNPVIAPLMNPVSHFAVKQLLALRPGSPFLAKTEGMLRFYLEGKKPLEKQNWPQPLLEGRALQERS